MNVTVTVEEKLLQSVSAYPREFMHSRKSPSDRRDVHAELVLEADRLQGLGAVPEYDAVAGDIHDEPDRRSGLDGLGPGPGLEGDEGVPGAANGKGPPRVAELRQRDAGQDAPDDERDDHFDEGEAAT